MGLLLEMRICLLAAIITGPIPVSAQVRAS